MATPDCRVHCRFAPPRWSRSVNRVSATKNGGRSFAGSTGRRPKTPVTSGADAAHFAHDLAALLASLRAAEVPVDACADPALHWYRSRPLRGIRDDIDAYLVACMDIAELPFDLEAATRFWQHALSLPDPPPYASTRWVHTDLLAENHLIRDGRLTAVFDFGGLALGHPSIDLISAWETLGPG